MRERVLNLEDDRLRVSVSKIPAAFIFFFIERVNLTDLIFARRFHSLPLLAIGKMKYNVIILACRESFHDLLPPSSASWLYVSIEKHVPFQREIF